MKKRNNHLLWLFVLGIFTSLIILPMLRTMGLSFDVLLVSLFGEDSVWALPFSLLLIVLIGFSFWKFSSKKTA